MTTDGSQTTLLRIAAFLVDALSISLLLVLPAALLSYVLAWIGGEIRVIQIVWYVALFAPLKAERARMMSAPAPLD